MQTDDHASAQSASGSGQPDRVLSGGKTLRIERVYPHPPEAVWVALTDPHALAEWAFPNDFRPELGHEFRFQFDPQGPSSGLIECRVLEIDPPRKMVWSWVGTMRNPKAKRPPAMRITWTVEPHPTGSKLVLFQEGMEVMPFLLRFMMKFGWGTMVGRWIPRIIAEGVREHGGVWTFTPGVIPLAKRCYKCQTIPEHLVR